MENNITQNIMDYMNSMGRKQFTYIEVSCIASSIKREYCDRKKKDIKINTKIKSGREELNRRIANIVNSRLHIKSITPKDVRIYKKCFAEEYAARTCKCAWGFKELRRRLGYDPKTGVELNI
ncbi:MAG: hypothetical protein LKF87_14595 [Clostridium tyrobutyricum]|jgi:hypothetical protein|uniref:hypothetical protein n=1 Tax=Clostridium tyrobutyricum TaxID=1519 RepID=UPI00242D35AB|nr:hypothetical protein [Clostridium tyrobutyricum]MCH4200649.1 hypothetical protein [Clostridium tyrobutyricum]MCH4237547.1 hypothetical protein [Clostridium tyrobutyricum]MCH4260142.1 hypothetical protein [Clostridium tyrobutyricum]MCI2011748.1 hypothetical protein [Clostridium tyrobutyricum]